MATLNLKGFPDPLYKKLQRRAKVHHRSVTQEVTAILTEAVSPPAPLSILELRGLGKDLWAGIDPVAHVDAERSSWE